MSDTTPVTCEDALRLLALFLDGELHTDAHERIEHHLEVCRSCFSRAEFERRLKVEVGRLRRDDVPAAFEQRVRRLIGAFGPGSTGEHQP
jgi:anti-sigma factor (TIGR02949 family)